MATPPPRCEATVILVMTIARKHNCGILHSLDRDMHSNRPRRTVLRNTCPLSFRENAYNRTVFKTNQLESSRVLLLVILFASRPRAPPSFPLMRRGDKKKKRPVEVR